jgi:hypothetical protein
LTRGPEAGPQKYNFLHEVVEHLLGNIAIIIVYRSYGWTGQQSGSGFFDLAPSILHYDWL